MLGCIFNILDRYWIDPKHVSDKSFVFNKTIPDQHDKQERNLYQMYRISFGEEKQQMKTFIGPLSFLTSKPLLLFFSSECKSSTFDFLIDILFQYFLLSNTVLHLTLSLNILSPNDSIILCFHYVGQFWLTSINVLWLH